MPDDKPIVLIVEDQPINAKLLQRSLERAEMKVEIAYNGRDCLRRIQDRKPDVILLDIMLPGMSGLQICQELKSRKDTQTIPVLFVTAKANREDKISGLALGANDYITKPIDAEEVVARIRAHLRNREIYRKNFMEEAGAAGTPKPGSAGDSKTAGISGIFRRTSSRLGFTDEQEFQLEDTHGNHIAFVDISELRTGIAFSKIIGKQVTVFGKTIEKSYATIIKAHSITMKK